MEDEIDFEEPAVERARINLFDGLETSRAIVRQTQVLIELSESSGLAAPSCDYDPTAR